jgi:hypothetical protein
MNMLDVALIVACVLVAATASTGAFVVFMALTWNGPAVAHSRARTHQQENVGNGPRLRAAL